MEKNWISDFIFYQLNNIKNRTKLKLTTGVFFLKSRYFKKVIIEFVVVGSFYENVTFSLDCRYSYFYLCSLFIRYLHIIFCIIVFSQCLVILFVFLKVLFQKNEITTDNIFKLWKIVFKLLKNMGSTHSLGTFPSLSWKNFNSFHICTNQFDRVKKN